ncbi:Aste57867_21282 [Aphanomyces stellatus]|uniref:Aste57867_21282 protein n=1 Tax=Aphanomyces stellatus TaxID=120398 RepID=A0A485LIE1_9STRA|nr:hypothetical protein As57867_021213 [Aphanomyces stellatus]VFT97954.1 Aste57867_21282 [Aphanomyces stellatus]
MAACLARHWTSLPPPKSAAQIEAETHLVCVPKFSRSLTSSAEPFNRWLLLAAACLIHICSGSLNAWPSMVTPMDAFPYTNPYAGGTVHTLYFAMASLGVSAALAGPWLERCGPGVVMLFGALCFGLGNVVTALSHSNHSIVSVYLGYGVLAGIGFGLTFLAALATLQ